MTSTLQAQRDSEEEGDYMAFEQLMADAQRKKEKEKTGKHDHAAAGAKAGHPPKPEEAKAGTAG